MNSTADPVVLVLLEVLEVPEVPELLEVVVEPDDEEVDPLDEPRELNRLERLDESEAPAEPEVLDEPDETVCGEKLAFPEPKPSDDALLPPIEMVSWLSLLVITRSPLPLMKALTLALPDLPLLMALIRSPTVSFPVEV